MPQWTEQQREAIHSSAGQIICSAAAGSGKTAVMIERIIRMLKEGANPESFLVVTFTNAAAAEMKQKIRQRLWEGREDRRLRSALEKLDLMEICTIHSFVIKGGVHDRLLLILYNLPENRSNLT